MLFRCLAEHGKFHVIHDKGQSEYVLNFIMVTPFRKVVLIPK